MDMYEILKVLNHNTILVLKENEEIIRHRYLKNIEKISWQN